MARPERNIRDRRIQKTQKLLREALLSIIPEKPYDAIAIKEILDRANVGRSTFYMHFRDKDDLLVSAMHDIIGAVQSPSQTPLGKGHERILWFSLPILDHHYQHRHNAGNRIGARARAILHEHLRRVLAGVIADVLQKAGRTTRKSGPLPPSLLASYVASTFVLVLNWWIDGGMHLRPKEVDDLFRTLILPTLASTGAFPAPAKFVD